MAFVPNVPQKPAIHPGALFAVLLTGVIGFALGQNWPLVEDRPETVTLPEDWHGNVRRSGWTQGD